MIRKSIILLLVSLFIPWVGHGKNMISTAKKAETTQQQLHFMTAKQWEKVHAAYALKTYQPKDCWNFITDHSPNDKANQATTRLFQNMKIQLSGDTTAETSGKDVMIRTRNLEPSESAAVVDSMTKTIGTNTVKRIETVGAVIGSEVTQHALLNLVIAFAVLALYISYRFEYKIAISALAAIFHDLIMVLGVFSFFQLEIDASFLAAILTVVGYSMNESVVIFDRVRENAHTHKRTDTFADLANASIEQSIHRSFYTLATVMFACVSLFVFGGDTTKNFALCMIIGFSSGAYSSICVATSLWVLWKNRNKNDIRNQ